MKYNPLADPCLSCGLWRDKKSPCIRPREYKKGGLVFIGEAPGENEDKAGDAFVGRAGEILRAILKRLGVGQYTLLNAVGCRPTDGYGRNRTPSVKEVAFCSPFLMEDIRLLEPSKLICLGRIAAKAVGFPDTRLGELRHRKWALQVYKTLDGSQTASTSPWEAPSGAPEDHTLSHLPIPLFVTYHPAAGLRPGKANLIKELENDLKEYLHGNVSTDSLLRGIPKGEDRQANLFQEEAAAAEKAEGNWYHQDDQKGLTNDPKHGILSIEGEEKKNGSDYILMSGDLFNSNSICVDIETSGFFKDHDAFPFDGKGEILLIGTDKGNVK